ncbi:MAG: polyprenyl synthetase family protein [Planctomycetes bacterium]|nr:polyprenyl synthetase family protein [Planctomycetota bacterium]
MNMQKQKMVESELARVSVLVTDYLLDAAGSSGFAPADLKEGALRYFQLKKKCIRPALLLNSCAAAGGNMKQALPAAAAVEAFHTWTLVHDDIIDNDDLRREALTVHRYFAEKTAVFGLSAKLSEEYGRCVAILAGDILQGFAVTLMARLAQNKVPPAVVIALIAELEGRLINDVMEGETVDVQLSFTKPGNVTEKQVLQMLAKKTAALLSFSCRAGAVIGTGKLNHKYADAVSNYAYYAGLAFQLQDDILGITGDQKKLGKPVGSDIREGKRTLIVLEAFKRADKKQTALLKRVLGNPGADSNDVTAVKDIFVSLGAVSKTQEKAMAFIKKSVKYLDILPASRHKEFLSALAEYIVDRNR